MRLRLTIHEEFASTATRRLLTRNSLSDIDAIFARGSSAPLRHKGRCVWETGLLDEQGAKQRVYVKMNWGLRRFWPRMTDLRTGQLFLSHPAREWKGLDRLRSIGIAVPEFLAIFVEGLIAFRAAILLRAVPPEHSILDLIRNGGWQRLSTDDRREMITEVVSTLSKIHMAGLGWRGVSTGHIFQSG